MEPFLIIRRIVLYLLAGALVLWLLQVLSGRHAITGQVQLRIADIDGDHQSLILLQGYSQMGTLQRQGDGAYSGTLLLSVYQSCYFCEDHWSGDLLSVDGKRIATVCGVLTDARVAEAVSCAGDGMHEAGPLP